MGELFLRQLVEVLKTISEREAGGVRLRFGVTDGQPRTLDEIGQVYGVTRDRIRQIESKTMSKLRHESRSQVLVEYLDADIDLTGALARMPDHVRERITGIKTTLPKLVHCDRH